MSGQDRPMGDREGTDNWTPEKVEQVSNEEVKNPAGDDKEADANGVEHEKKQRGRSH